MQAGAGQAPHRFPYNWVFPRSQPVADPESRLPSLVNEAVPTAADRKLQNPIDISGRFRWRALLIYAATSQATSRSLPFAFTFHLTSHRETRLHECFVSFSRQYTRTLSSPKANDGRLLDIIALYPSQRLPTIAMDHPHFRRRRQPRGQELRHAIKVIACGGMIGTAILFPLANAEGLSFRAV
jgi:hypothetical protein